MDRREVLAKSVLSIMPLYHKKLIRKLHCQGISRHQMTLLNNIWEHDGMPMSYYGEKLMISKPNLSKLVNKFFEEGLIERQADENDRRITKLFITEKGKKEIKEHGEVFTKEVADRFEKLSDEDVDSLIDSYENITKIFDKL